jgi:hypothetical protein
MYGVTGMEVRMAEHIRSLTNGSSAPHDNEFDSHTHLIHSKHIAYAVHLPQGHSVREILAAASVKGYLQKEEHKFIKEAVLER